MATYGSKMAEFRKKNNLTQAQLGKQLNVSAQAVSKWENGLSEPDIGTLRKMSAIFNVSIAKLIGEEKVEEAQPEVAMTEATEVEEQSSNEQPVFETPPVKIIRGYCEMCKKPVGPNEYETRHLRYNPSKLTNKVETTTEQRIYCIECDKKLSKIISDENKKKIDSQEAVRKQEAKTSLKKGLLWGIFYAIIGALAGGLLYFLYPTTETLITAIFMFVGAYALSALVYWDCYVTDVFGFFCRSFTAPFNLIFELSLDGIIWLLTVKLVLWIICGILSALFFLMGLFVSMALSIISFPFILPRKIQETK